MSDYQKLLDECKRLGYNTVKAYVEAVSALHNRDVDWARNGIFAFVGDLYGFEQWVKTGGDK